MASNFNNNQRTLDYSYKTRTIDHYPVQHMSSAIYDTDNTWQENGFLSPRMSDNRRLDNISLRSSSQNYDSVRSKDEFSIFGSSIRQKSEKINLERTSDGMRTSTRQSSNFKTLPVKTERSIDLPSTEYTEIITSTSAPRQQSQPKYTPKTEPIPNSLFELIQSQDSVDNRRDPGDERVEYQKTSRVEAPVETIIPQRKAQVESALQAPYPEDDLKQKDEEISRLNRSVEKMTKKVAGLENNNREYQERLKNLLKERRELLKQIESSEFEEIIEEEEVQKAKPNYVPRENVTRVEYIREEAPKPVEVSHANCLQRGRITLDDVPQKMLESFRTDILKQEKERTEMEKRSLVEALKVQQQKQIQSLQAEFEVKQRAIENVSVKSYKKTVFNQKVSESNLRRTPSPKSDSRSVAVSVYPVVTSTPSQSELLQPRSALNKYMAKTVMTKWQKSIIDRVINSVEGNNYEGLIKIFEEVLCPPTKTVGINCTTTSSTKSTNTTQVDISDVTVEVNTVTEIIKPKISQKSCGTMAKPVLIQRGCQPEDIFKFDSGTSTDQKFSRSQGVMTTGDYNGYRSPSGLEVDSIVNKTNNRVESRKQTISHSVYMTSPTKELSSNHEVSISPKVVKVTQQVPETMIEHIVEVKKSKKEEVPLQKPLNVVEEVKHTVEERTEQVTTILDQNRNPKQEIPTTIEYWETLSKIKDGEVIEKTETYHDKIVSTDIEKIKEHLDQHDHSHSNEVSPIFKPESGYFRTSSQTHSSKVGSERSPTSTAESNFQDIKSKFESVKSTPKEYFPVKNSPEIKDSKFIEIRDFSNSGKLSKTTDSKETKIEKIQSPQPSQETYHESKHKVISGSIKRSTGSKETKIQSNLSTTTEASQRDSEQKFNTNVVKRGEDSKETYIRPKLKDLPTKETFQEKSSEKSYILSGIKKPSEIRETKVYSVVTSVPIKDTVDHDSEQRFGSNVIKKLQEVKDDEVVTKSSRTPLKETYQHSEEKMSFSNLARPVEIKEIKVEKTSNVPIHEAYRESEEIIVTSALKKPIEIKETQHRQDFNIPSRTTYQESERTFRSNVSQQSAGSMQVEVQKQSSSLPHNDSYRDSEVRYSSRNLRNPIEIKESNIQLPMASNESSYQEIEHTVITTTTSSIIPVAIETVNATVNMMQSTSPPVTFTSRTSNPSGSIGALISPTSFQSYSSNKPRTNFASSRTETYSFESEERHVESPPRTQFGQSVPINVSSFESTTRATRIPVNVTSNKASASSIASSNSAFHSLSSAKEGGRIINVPVEVANFKTEYNELPLPDIIMQNCEQLFVWLKHVSPVTVSTVDNLPSNLIPVSATLMDWWVDVTVNTQSTKLSTIVNFILSTFGKSLLKYFIVTMDQQGNTCLHYIIGNQVWDSFKVLTETNLIDPNIFNAKGYTVLMVASTLKITSDGALNCIRKLASGASFNLKSKFEGQTALCIAALHGNSETIQMLFSMGADINLRDNDDNTPLMIACKKNNSTAVKTLLSLPGLSVDVTNKDGKTAMDIVQDANFTELLEIFNERKTTRTSEVAGYSRVIHSSYSNKSFGSRKF